MEELWRVCVPVVIRIVCDYTHWVLPYPENTKHKVLIPVNGIGADSRGSRVNYKSTLRASWLVVSEECEVGIRILSIRATLCTMKT